ncbi:DUF433 domain-containing protein [Sphingomonas sp. LB3N6]|uniref:DUF433 domain-containing protein n=1 Tax=Sphingomonas fucosidasi TaxID=3096164 RepID=UPI002FC7B5A5
MPDIEPVTLQEAQFLVGRPVDEISKAIERGEVEKRIVLVVEPAKSPRKKMRRGPRGRRSPTQTVHGYVMPKTVTQKVRKLGEDDLVYLALGRDVQENFTPSARKLLYQAIKTRPTGADKVSIGPVDIALKPAIIQLMKRYRALQDIRTGILERSGSEPVFKSAGIPVYLIAALAEGQGVEATLADYPTLKRKQVERARDYARAYPKKGRPYPTRSLKTAVSELAAVGVFAPIEDPQAMRPEDFQ